MVEKFINSSMNCISVGRDCVCVYIAEIFSYFFFLFCHFKDGGRMIELRWTENYYFSVFTFI